ncbi:MAG: hypothetical protein LUD12_02770 [Lachnospiraceae bacterium]|nr:hypothetical protein [Lachnospiraceae bacterium]
MKFKEIKPGMVIHCPTEEDARALLEHLDSLGYRWGMTHKNLVKMPCWNTYTDKTCYMIEDNKDVLYPQGDAGHR